MTLDGNNIVDLDDFHEGLSYKVAINYWSDQHLTASFPGNIFLNLEPCSFTYNLLYDNDLGCVTKHSSSGIDTEIYPIEITRLAVMYDLMCFAANRNLVRNIIHHYDENGLYLCTGGFETLLQFLQEPPKLEIETKILGDMRLKLENWLDDIVSEEASYYILLKKIEEQITENV